MKKFILAAIVLLSTALPALASDKQADEVFDRVMKTHTLRCAYTIYPTFIEKDPNTGKMGGLFYDLVTEMGQELNLKIEWTVEIGTDAIFEGFRTNKYDAVCAGYSSAPARTWGGDFSKPLVFIPYNVYVRAHEDRFKTLADFNKANLSFSVMDGEMGQLVIKEAFPLAQQKSLPALTPATDRFEVVVAGKADATTMESEIGSEYMAHNPGKIMRLGAEPLQVLPSVIIIPHKEEALKAMLNNTIETMQDSGALARIIKAHEKYPGAMLLPARMYQLE